jgi:signal transduction histidine kinase
MVKATPIIDEGQRFILSTLEPGRTQRRLAIVIVLALLVALFLAAGPLATLKTPRIDAFVPAYATALVVIDLITAVLLFAQFSILRSRALLVIGNGYLYTALIVVPWTLTYPGVFTPGGLLGAGLQTTNWLYILWHTGFSVFVIAYALVKYADPAKELWQGSAGAAIVASVAMTTAVVCAATVLVTAGHDQLPRTMLDTVHFSPLRRYIAAFQVFLSVAAIVALWGQRRTLLDMWLMVVMCAHVVEISLIAFPVPVRFSFGWYVGRLCGLVSSSLVLVVLLYEITTLYGELLHAVFAKRREREARLLTGEAIVATIAHEVRQPLTGMVANASAGLRWLNRAMPDVDEAKTALEHIVADGRRAAAVIERVRGMFKGDLNRTAFDLNSLVRETLTLVEDAVQRDRILVRTELNALLPLVIGDRVQLQQVLLNLIANSIEAMAVSEQERILSVKSEVHHDGAVAVSVTDTGTGIGSQDIDRIFDPLFTRKSDGMGMGLAICRSIIEAHNGQIRVAPNKPQGAVFQFVLFADSVTAAGAIRGERREDHP